MDIATDTCLIVEKIDGGIMQAWNDSKEPALQVLPGDSFQHRGGWVRLSVNRRVCVKDKAGKRVEGRATQRQLRSTVEGVGRAASPVIAQLLR